MALTKYIPIISDVLNNGNPQRQIITASEYTQFYNQETKTFNVYATATTNISLTTPGTIDGVTPNDGQLFLLIGQSDPTENFIYYYDLTADELILFEWAVLLGEANQISLVYTLEGGTANGTHIYKFTTLNPNIGVDNLTWEDIATDLIVSANALTESAVVAAATTISAQDIVAKNASNELVLARAGTADAAIYQAVGMAITGGTAGQTVQFVTFGQVTGSFSFSGGQIGNNLWVDPTTAGDYTLTAPSTVNQYQVLIGFVESTNAVFIQSGLRQWNIVQ